MKLRLRLLALLSVAAIVSFLIFSPKKVNQKLTYKQLAMEEIGEEQEAKFDIARMKYEFDLLKDPATGTIPKNIFATERKFAQGLPERTPDYIVNGTTSRTSILNNYLEAGPNNIGGRTRALAYDVRNNKVVLGGCVSGGIMRSTDGGGTWVRVSPENDIHSFTAIVQDPRAGNQDTWYAGGGEALGNSASIPYAAIYMANGIWKSTNNGASWTKLTLNITSLDGNSVIGAGALEAFDNTFDLVHRLAVNPLNGNLYIAGHRRIVRSTDGGASFRVVFEGNAPANSSNGQTDVTVTNSGKVYIAINGGNPDPSIRGVWFSTTAGPGRAEWNRISGGQTLNVDSVSQWRGNEYADNGSKRILIAVAPSNQNLLYTFYENGLSSEGAAAKPEGDLFRYDAGANTWSNRSANMPDFPNTTYPNVYKLNLQGGYNMLLSIKPDDPNFVLIGGTSLYRSTDGFATSSNTSWIGGYGPTYPRPGAYPNSHPDMHTFSFNPANSKQGICGNDGGVQTTDDVTVAGNNVSWTLPAKYQTLQYYYVAMDPETNRNNFAGGAQDNGTTFRDGERLFGNPTGDPNNQISVFVNDGTSVGFSKFSANPLEQVIYSGYQYGYIYRQKFAAVGKNDSIKPSGAITFNADNPDQYGEFVTVFKLNQDNTEDLFYANFNKLFRTTSASTVTPTTWTEMTGVKTAIGGALGSSNIRALAFSRGLYAPSHALYIGTTRGQIFRLDNPRNMAAATVPVNITPPLSLGWSATGNVQDIAVNPNNDNEIMAVVSNYGLVSIWWTNNAKAASPNWVNAEGNLTLPSIRCCKIIVKKDAGGNAVQEYYVGTSVGLYSVANLNTLLPAGTSPTWQREGGNVLNQAVVVDMAYRPVDNTLLIGTHGNGMYYTSVGTPNFTPNLNTGIINPVLNDKNFITTVYPTLASNNINYQIGNLTGIKNITVALYNIKGQKVAQYETAYQSGNLPIDRFAKGSYILTITSSDNKYRHVQKLMKQ